MDYVIANDLVEKYVERQVARGSKAKVMRNLLIWGEREYDGAPYRQIAARHGICMHRCIQIHKKMCYEIREFKANYA